MRSWPLALSFVLVAGCGGTTVSDDASTDTPLDAAPACNVDGDCDDGLFCNGSERCVAHGCTSGMPMRCDDAVACTTDVCSETTHACSFRVPDVDGDGVGTSLCLDALGTALGTDCDDADANRFPGNHETCDAAMHDEDCDDATHGGVDADGDGFEDHRCCDGAHCGDDCDDGHASAHPGATETCNLVDDDCNGTIDDGVATAGFVDADRDGFGDPTMPITTCASAASFAADGTDCDDTLATRNPGQVELCDGVDNDCNGMVDDHTANVTWYRDVDGDGFGRAASGTMSSCTPPPGFALRGTDCNDAAAGISPASPELCNGVDDDCNGVADFVIGAGDLEDDDRDGIADLGCAAPLGRDCDDRDATSAPGTVETCDGRDNDCDGRTDEGATEIAFYRDGDGDGFGDSSNVRLACTPPTGFVPRGGDCDDSVARRSPGASEACNALDDDCDGATDEGSVSSSCPIASGSIQACVAGHCAPVGCAPSFADCESATPGCETAYLTDPRHCGSCTNDCGAFRTCTAGRCGPTLSFAAIDNEAGDVDVERVLSLPASTDVVLLGSFTGTVHVGTTTLTSVGGRDGFAARVRIDTTALWAIRWGGPGDDAMHAAAMLADGSAFVVGGEQCGGSICGGPIAGCTGFWQRFPTIAATGCNYAEGVAASTSRIYALAMEHVGINNYVYAAGLWFGTADHGIGASSSGYDGFVLRARETGGQPVVEWVRRFTGTYDEVPLDIAIDPTTNQLGVVGYTSSSADFGGGATAHAGFDDPFIVTLDRTTGALIQGFQFGLNTGYDHAQRLVYLADGTLIVGGYHAPGSYATGAVGTGALNAFVMALRPSTTILWAQTWSSNAADVNGLTVAGSRVFASGQFAGSLQVGTSTLSPPSASAFLFGLDAASGAVQSLLVPTGGPASSGGVAALPDGRVLWEIDHSGALNLDGQSVVGGIDVDMARALVTP